MAFNTGNPIGSTSTKDLFDNAQNLDLLMLGDKPAYPDRKGVPRKSWKGMEAEYDSAHSAHAAQNTADKLFRDTVFGNDQSERYAAFASMSADFGRDQAQRVIDFALLMRNTGYEVPVSYAPGILITRTTQTLTYIGNQYRVKIDSLPLMTSTWDADAPKMALIGDASLRQELTGPDGSKRVEYKGRTIFDRMSEEVYFKDAPFFGKMDGSDDSAAWLRVQQYIREKGGRINLGIGRLYLKDARLLLNMADGAFKTFVISGAGPGLTHISFGNISPKFDGTGAIYKKEPNLFDCSGVSGLQIAPRHRYENFSFDYTEQVFKGGASIESPALTDIKPLSKGIFAFTSEFSDGMEIENVIGHEVYGNGVILSRSPNSLIKNVHMYNVSAGNPGSEDNTGGFIGVMRGSQVGTLVSHCTAINTRVYKTDTIAGFNTSSAKNTMCGYIGVWTEYGIEVGSVFAPGTNLWGEVEPKNVNSMGCRVENCLVYGYTLGFKLEGYTPSVFDSCVAINCWVPYIGAASQGRIVNCYADGGVSDGLICPQSGYEYVRALFVHYNVNAPVWAYAGFTFDGCMGYTRRMRINTTNCDNGRFLNQQIVIDHSGTGGDVNILATRSNKTMRGAKVSGTYTIKGLGEDKAAIIYDMADMGMDISVVNLTDKQYTVSPSKYYAGEGCARSTIKISTDGLVRVAASGSPGIVIDHKGRMTNPLHQFRSNALAVGDCTDAVINYNLTLHTKCVPAAANNFGYVSVNCITPDISGSITFVDSGAPEVLATLFSNSVQPTVKLSKEGDPYSLPMIITGTSGRGMHIRGMRTNDDTTPVFDIRYTLYGPITYDAGAINAGKFSLQTLNYEPNHPNLMTSEVIHYLPGLSYSYLRPALGGKSGCRVHVGGIRAVAWAGAMAVALNALRATESQVYKATTAGTTGATAPTHTSGAASDGSVVWTWHASRARFVETADVGTNLL